MNTTSTSSSTRGRRIASIVLWVLGAIGAYVLVTQHFDHVLQALPYLLLLACPLLHVFGHRHGHGGGHDKHTQRPARDE